MDNSSLDTYDDNVGFVIGLIWLLKSRSESIITPVFLVLNDGSQGAR